MRIMPPGLFDDLRAQASLFFFLIALDQQQRCPKVNIGLSHSYPKAPAELTAITLPSEQG